MEKKQFFETLKKFKTTIALALLTIFSSTYSYFAELAFYKFDETQKTLAGSHIIFFFAFTVLLLALIIFASKRLVRKFSFVREVTKELEAKQ
jgi:hypothetical protein